jgi:hypothetical protein
LFVVFLLIGGFSLRRFLRNLRDKSWQYKEASVPPEETESLPLDA